MNSHFFIIDEQCKKIKKEQEGLDRSDKTLSLIKWFVLGIIEVTFSDDIILTAGIFKENDRLYAVNVNKDVAKVTRIINCRLDFESLMDKAGITEADAVYTDPIYYPIVPVNEGETTDTAYWVVESSNIVESDWSDAHKVMAFCNYIIDNFAYDKWAVSKGEHNRWFYYNDFTGKYYISQTHVGVCEDFSHVFAIMCRAQIIPALDTVWTDANIKRYAHLNDVSDTEFGGVGIGIYQDMKNFGIPTYD